MVAPHIAVGMAGEDLAAAWYSSRGYTVLDRNWRCQIGEIDLVLRLGHTLVISEVKSRRSGSYGTPAHAVDPAKRRRLRRLAAAWLAEHRPGRVDVRFDVVAVTGGCIEVYEQAF